MVPRTCPGIALRLVVGCITRKPRLENFFFHSTAVAFDTFSPARELVALRTLVALPVEASAAGNLLPSITGFVFAARHGALVSAILFLFLVVFELLGPETETLARELFSPCTLTSTRVSTLDPLAIPLRSRMRFTPIPTMISTNLAVAALKAQPHHGSDCAFLADRSPLPCDTPISQGTAKLTTIVRCADLLPLEFRAQALHLLILCQAETPAQKLVWPPQPLAASNFPRVV